MRGESTLIELRNKAGKLLSPYYYIQFNEGGRNYRQSTGYKVGKEAKQAQDYFTKWKYEKLNPIRHSTDEWIVTQALDDYYNEHLQYTASKQKGLYQQGRLKKYFGSHYVSQLTPSVILKYVRECQEKEESNATIRLDLQHLTAALNHEVREQRIPYAPKFKLPPPPPPKERVLSIEEVQKLIAACITPHIKHFTILMLHTAQRPAKVENLKWEQVDFKQQIIHFDKTTRFTQLRQSNKQVRPVPMTEEVYALLKELWENRTTDYVLEYTPPGKNKKPRHAGCVKVAFSKACKNAGLEGVTRYTLRHSVLDRMDELEVDDKTKSDIAGHTNTKTTRTHYIKSKIPRQRKALANIWKVA